MKTKKVKSNEMHVSHNLAIAMPKVFTVGLLKKQLERLNVPDDAVLKAAENPNWRWIMQVSYCRTANEVSLW